MEYHWDFTSHVLEGRDRRDEAPSVFAKQPLPPENGGRGAMCGGPLKGVPPLSGGGRSLQRQLCRVQHPRVRKGLRAIRERSLGPVPRLNVAAQAQMHHTFIVFNARTGVAAKDAHQVPTCLLRQVVKAIMQACEYGRLLPTAPLILHSCLSFPRLTLRDRL